jgi:hypothetical protein
MSDKILGQSSGRPYDLDIIKQMMDLEVDTTTTIKHDPDKLDSNTGIKLSRYLKALYLLGRASAALSGHKIAQEIEDFMKEEK